MAEKHFTEVMMEEAPDACKAFFNLADILRDDAGLDAKTFQLIYIAIKTSIGETGAVVAHAGYAKQAGATREEVLGAMLITLMTNGVHGIQSCLIPALEAYDNA